MISYGRIYEANEESLARDEIKYGVTTANTCHEPDKAN